MFQDSEDSTTPVCTVGCFCFVCFSLLVKGEIKSSTEFKAFMAGMCSTCLSLEVGSCLGRDRGPVQHGPDPAARGAKCAELCIEPGATQLLMLRCQS